MSGIYWSADEAQLKTFSSATKGGAKGTETILKIELQVKDPYALGSLLHQLSEINSQQTVPMSAKAKKAIRKHVLALPKPALQITDMREERE